MGLGKDEVMEKAEIMTDAERDKLIAVLGMAVLLLKEELQGLHNEIGEGKREVQRLRNDFTTRKMMQSVGEDKQKDENALVDLRIDVIHQRTDAVPAAYEHVREDQKGLRNELQETNEMVGSTIHHVLTLTQRISDLEKLVLDKIVPPVV